jgi:cytochrome P450
MGNPSTTPVLVTDLDLPLVEPRDDLEIAERNARLLEAAEDNWLVRTVFGHMVLRYDDVVAVLRDKRWHSAASRVTEIMGITDPAFTSRRRTSILSAEGEEHTRLRRLVGQAFSPRAADRLRPFMREVINSLVDPVAPAGRADIAVDICEPYPIPIICELLGAPRADWKLFSTWAADVLKVFDGDLAEKLDVVMAAQDALDAYTRDLIADRRDKPAEDLLTDLIAAEEGGDRLSTEELVVMVEAVIIGGTDTTRNQLGCAVATLAHHPDQWAALADDPGLAPHAVEELMRYFGAVRGTVRFASEDIEYRGVLFPAGSLINVSMASANFDPTVFPGMDTLDVGREPPGKPQLTFGSGIHYCLGAALARAELQEALPILARRMPDLRLDGPVQWKPPTAAIFGAERLPVTFTPTV